MAYPVYLRGGPEPVGVRTDNRLVTVTDPDTDADIRVPVAGGLVARFRRSDEQIAVDDTVAAVFDFVGTDPA